MNRKNYLCIDSLCAKYPDWWAWGKVGMCLETGERIYVTNYEKQGEMRYLGDNTWRRIIRGDQSDRYSASYWGSTKFPERGTKGIDDEVIQTIEAIIDEHIAYNLARGLPIDRLLQNRKRYSVVYELGNPIFFSSYAATYEPATHTIYIPFTSFKNISANAKEEFICYLRHEIGHMKVSDVKVKDDYSTLFVTTGIDKHCQPLQRQTILDGGNLLVPLELPGEELTTVALEEIANELELKAMAPHHQFSYADFGTRLNQITRGALQLSRYQGGLDFFMEELLKIIPSEIMAIQLLDAIAGNFRKEDEQGVAHVNNLMDEYEQYAGSGPKF